VKGLRTRGAGKALNKASGDWNRRSAKGVEFIS